MTVREVFDRLYELRPAEYDESGLLARLTELENTIATEVHFEDPIAPLTMDSPLRVGGSYGSLYLYYLLAQIDLNDMEEARYAADAALYIDRYQEYAAWYRRSHRPAHGAQVTLC